ncbi:MAG: SagB/ThcOx family dehydrogenase [Spirochaetes bacterium]|nr:SagB/ThcOx family dehydrogenase [Spirochaetota bacterium]
MKNTLFHYSQAIVAALYVLLCITPASGGDIVLPAPETDGGMPLMRALRVRHSEREFSQRGIPLQTLSNLLWAADGINRPVTGKRTAPSAMNSREIDIYAAMKDGLYRYNAKRHALEVVGDRDIRHLTGIQDFIKTAPLNLVYVADHSRMGNIGMADKETYSAIDTGYISQNVYLFCASHGLVTVARGYMDRTALARAMGLTPQQKIILSQTVGFPK